MNLEAGFPQDDDRLSRGLWISLGAHAVLFLYFVLRMTVFNTEVPIPSSIRVDMVALPEKNQQLPAKAEERAQEPPAKEEAKSQPPAATVPPRQAKKEPEAINLKKTKANEKAAFDKLKAMQALDKIRNDVRNEKPAPVAKPRPAGKVKGNILAAGSALTGIDQLQHDEYQTVLDHHIKPYWQLPEWMQHKHLIARVLVKVDGQGRLVSRRIVKTSGNPDFDESVLETIDRSTPLPAPPEKFIEMVSQDGILIEFGQEGG